MGFGDFEIKLRQIFGAWGNSPKKFSHHEMAPKQNNLKLPKSLVEELGGAGKVLFSDIRIKADIRLQMYFLEVARDGLILGVEKSYEKQRELKRSYLEMDLLLANERSCTIMKIRVSDLTRQLLNNPYRL